jgi:hypothetical protein
MRLAIGWEWGTRAREMTVAYCPLLPSVSLHGPHRPMDEVYLSIDLAISCVPLRRLPCPLPHRHRHRDDLVYHHRCCPLSTS